MEVFSNQSSSVLGTVLDDSQLVSMAASSKQLLIASAGTLYLLDLGSGAFSTIPAANFSGAVSLVGYSDGFFIVLITDSRQIYASAVEDGSTWPGLSTTIVSLFPDNIVSMIIDHREIWLFSKRYALVYENTGAFPFPFEPNQSAFIEQGCVAKFGPAKLDNTILWPGIDERGQGMIWRASGYTPTRISNHAVEFAFQDYSRTSRISDAISYAFQDQGHNFYHLYFPSANKSWRYDTATNMWHEVGFWNAGAGFFEAHHSQVHTFNFGKHLVGDWQSEKIYDMEIPKWNGSTWDFATDNGSLIRRVRRAAHISDDQKFSTHHQVQIFLETGLGSIPALPGTGIPTSIILADPNGALWSMGITDSGSLTSTPGATGTPQILFFNDADTNTTSWLLGVDINGALVLTPAAYNANYLTSLAMIGESGTLLFTFYVDINGAANTGSSGTITRAPQLSISWSNDSGHSFSNEYILDCGQAGEFKARVMKRRLGRARDRVYQISMSDPIPWRIVAGYAEIGA
jgi:hypothetical protein